MPAGRTQSNDMEGEVVLANLLAASTHWVPLHGVHRGGKGQLPAECWAHESALSSGGRGPGEGGKRAPGLSPGTREEKKKEKDSDVN